MLLDGLGFGLCCSKFFRSPSYGELEVSSYNRVEIAVTANCRLKWELKSLGENGPYVLLLMDVYYVPLHKRVRVCVCVCV